MSSATSRTVPGHDGAALSGTNAQPIPAAQAALDTATPALVAASRIAVIVCGRVTATVEHLHVLNSRGRETERGR
ncbi:hypothetical protein BGV66_01305 [Burkholderia ubonensis]|uniref:Uncharacterized protein n=1 Tax=Burkholderia ubonensis TaxID=101571 RepID=A0ABD6QB10_9BURK|nr:hypothetical protein BGV66_01305 [Burkholderia ubonensis]